MHPLIRKRLDPEQLGEGRSDFSARIQVLIEQYFGISAFNYNVNFNGGRAARLRETSLIPCVRQFRKTHYTNNTRMQFQYEISAEEYVAGQTLYCKLMHGSNGFLKPVAWGLGGLCFLATAWSERDIDWPAILLSLTAAWFIYCAIVQTLPAFYFRSRYPKSEFSDHPFQADVTQEGFHVSDDLRAWHIKWPGVQAKGENRDVFVFYSANTVFIFGKKYLSDQQQSELRQLAGLTSAV